MAQWVKCLDFGSGHDLTVGEFEPCEGLCINSAEPARDSLSLPFSIPLSFSHKINKLGKKKKKKKAISIKKKKRVV